MMPFNLTAESAALFDTVNREAGTAHGHVAHGSSYWRGGLPAAHLTRLCWRNSQGCARRHTSEGRETSECAASSKAQDAESQGLKPKSR